MSLQKFDRRSQVILLAAIASIVIFPIFDNPFEETVMITFFMWTVLAVSWNLLLGFGGIPAFGNLTFFAVGGYTSAYLGLHGYLPWAAILVGTTFSAIVGLGMGAPTLRLRGIYVALFTFASEELLRNTVLLADLVPWTGGSLGLQGVPHFPIDTRWLSLFNYYFAFGILLLTCGSVFLLLRSRVGLALISVRESELYAESLGVNVYRHKLLAFILSALFSGFVGAFYAHYTGAFTPSNLSFTLLLQILVMILIGGLGTQIGPVVGAFILTFLSEYLRASLAGQVALFRLAVIGLLIPIVLILFPSGLARLVDRFRKPLRRTLQRAAPTI